jgi:hypothetical protein
MKWVAAGGVASRTPNNFLLSSGFRFRALPVTENE